MESEIQVKQPRSAFANRLAKARTEPSFRVKQRRELVAAHLGAAIAGLGFSRIKVAQKAKMKPAQLSRQLSGSVNLTIDTVGRICDAVGLDFDVIYRLTTHDRARQPWERIQSVSNTWHNVRPIYRSTDQRTIDLPLNSLEFAKSRTSSSFDLIMQGQWHFMPASEREVLRA